MYVSNNRDHTREPNLAKKMRKNSSTKKPQKKSDDNKWIAQKNEMINSSKKAKPGRQAVSQALKF